jgi:potassium-dependent mechanosensitive channel
MIWGGSIPVNVGETFPPLRLTRHALALAFACMVTPGLAAAPEATTSPPAGASPAAPVITLYDIVGELGRTDTMRREIAATLRETSALDALAATLDDPILPPDLVALEESPDQTTRARYMELQALDVHIRERGRALDETTAALGRLTEKLVADLDRLDREAGLWPQRVALARERGAPADLQRAFEAVGPELAELRKPLLDRRDQFLVAYEHAVRMQAQVKGLLAQVAERRAGLSIELRLDRTSPIWEPGAVGLPVDELRANSRVMRAELLDYLRHNGDRVALLLVALTAVLFFFLRRGVAAGAQHASMPRLSAGTALCGALAVALPCAVLFSPPGPFVFYRLVWFLFPLCAAVVATRAFARTIPATAWTLGFAVFLNELRVVAEMSPATDWLLLVVQIVPFVVALVRDWRRGALSVFLARWPRILVDRCVQTMVALLSVALVANMVGYAGIANIIVAATLIAPGFMLMFAAVAWTLDRAFAGLLATPLMRSFRSVRERGDGMLRALHWIVVLVAWTVGVLTFAISYSALDDLIRIGTFITTASVSAGNVTITLSATLAALAVVVLTWLVTKTVRFVLDHEILPRLDLRTGVPVAISTIVGYLLVVTGAVLAMAALGIDLTKVTLIAGALGIGVGLGLQNVINNFASGLILMLERPINIGDQVDLGGVVGEVRRIGVRSSTIRTFQGAEVIVPNADLASKQVTNWTLSDRERRYEIDVGVAYGSDPQKVLRLLEAAAAEVPEVQKVPQPRALFTGFGDSSLDFRLFAWVQSVDIGLQAQNGLRMAILRLFAQAGIEIPFPQRDLHIRQAASELPTPSKTR